MRTIIKTINAAGNATFAVVASFSLQDYMAEIYGHHMFKELADHERGKPARQRDKNILHVETQLKIRRPDVTEHIVEDYAGAYHDSDKYDRSVAECLVEMFDDPVLKEVLLR